MESCPSKPAVSLLGTTPLAITPAIAASRAVGSVRWDAASSAPRVSLSAAALKASPNQSSCSMTGWVFSHSSSAGESCSAQATTVYLRKSRNSLRSGNPAKPWTAADGFSIIHGLGPHEKRLKSPVFAASARPFVRSTAMTVSTTSLRRKSLDSLSVIASAARIAASGSAAAHTWSRLLPYLLNWVGSRCCLSQFQNPAGSCSAHSRSARRVPSGSFMRERKNAGLSSGVRVAAWFAKDAMR